MKDSSYIWTGHTREWVAQSPEFIRDLTRQPVVPFQPSRPAREPVVRRSGLRGTMFAILMGLAAMVVIVGVILGVLWVVTSWHFYF